MLSINILQVTVTPETVITVTNSLQAILSDAPSEDQTPENVDIVADVLSTMSNFQITEEVSVHVYMRVALVFMLCTMYYLLSGIT